MPIILPNPSQVLQAPIGLLKLKKFISGSSNDIPSATNKLEKWCSLYDLSFFSIKISHSPFPSKKAVCTLSATLFWRSSSEISTTILSINKKIVSDFFDFFASNSAILVTWLLTKILEKPCWFNSSK